MSDPRNFRNKWSDVPSFHLFLPVYERVCALALTRLNALEVTSLSDICRILFILLASIQWLVARLTRI